MDHIALRLEHIFTSAADSARAQAQAAYMKHKFQFFGISKPERAQLEKEFFKSCPITSHDELKQILTILWNKPQREFQYTACELAQKHHKLWTPDFFEVFESMIRTHSWWDSVDTIASNMVGKLLLKYPELQNSMDAWIDDDNFWIQRTALLFQLRYKEKTDEQKLFGYCKKRAHEKEFFIRKAIGWALREYSKTNPKSVKEFLVNHKDQLSPLSYKEANKYF